MDFHRYATHVIRLRWWVILFATLVTVALAAQIRNLRIVVDPNTMLPQHHPHVVGTNLAERVFGTNYLLVVAVLPRHGDVYRPELLARVRTISDGLLQVPNVRKHTLMSLSAQRAKGMRGTAEGLEVRPLMGDPPLDERAAQAVREAVRANPAYADMVVAADGRAAAITIAVEKTRQGFRPTLDAVEALVAPLRSDEVDIAVGGVPMYLGQIEQYAQRMGVLFLVALGVVGLLHLEAFRTVQGLVLPLVTALLSVVWGLGLMGWAGVSMDAFNSTTPILILAVTAGHAVQVLKRYYEEHGALMAAGSLDPRAASREAVARAIGRIAPVMLSAGGVAVAGLFSLAGFDVATIRTFGLFTGLGVLSGMVLELTLIPAVRAMLKPPIRHTTPPRLDPWGGIIRRVQAWVLGPRRRGVYLLVLALAVPLGYGASHLSHENSYRRYFSADLPFQQQDALINQRLSGSNTLYVTFDGGHADAITDPKLLTLIGRTQDFIATQPHVGKAVSLVDLVQRMNAALHGEDPAHAVVPASSDEISQYLLLYGMSGEPTDFDRYIDHERRYASIATYLKSDSSVEAERLVREVRHFIDTQGGAGPGVEVQFGGSVLQSSALAQVLVEGKLRNIAQVCAVVLLVSALVFRSTLAGLLVVTPLVFTVLANFGLMGLAGIPLNTPNAISAAMAVGVGADYAIYLLHRMREEVRRGATLRQAVEWALGSAGRASLYVAAAIAGGYTVLMFSVGFNVHIWFGILIVCSMVVSVFASLLILPVLVQDLAPRFLRPRAQTPPLSPTAGASAAALLVAVLMAAPADGARAEPAPSAESLMQKSYEVSRFDASRSEATFRLIDKEGSERTRQTEGATLMQEGGRDNRRYTRFTGPADIRNTATLLVEHAGGDDDIWIYLPTLKKTRRLSSSNKKDAFVGTDFSYGDVIGHRVEAWVHQVTGRDEASPHRPWVVESRPANPAVEAQSGYSRRISWIDPATYLAERGEFYDRQGQLLKVMTQDKPQLGDEKRGRWQPMRMEMRNVQTGHRTVIEFSRFEANREVSARLFQPQALEQER